MYESSILLRGLPDDTQTIRWIIHPELKDLFITIVTTNPHVGLYSVEVVFVYCDVTV